MDEAIAYGATVKASQLSGQNQENSDILLQDVTPLSLGIEDAYQNMGVIVPKNSQIPLSMVYPAIPQFENQANVIIDIYQGEERKATDNHKVGGFTMKIAKRRDLVLNVCFEIDENGLLTVTAQDPVTKKSANIKITSDKLNLSELEIKNMAKKAKKQRQYYEQMERQAEGGEAAQGKNKKGKDCIIF